MENDLSLAFRHFPLSGIHPYAQQAVKAAEAVGAQGRFWEMHDLLFKEQIALKTKDLEHYRQRLAGEDLGWCYIDETELDFS